MKFKNVKTLSLLLAAAVMSLTSCNEQQLTPDVKPDLSGKTFYLSGALALPSTPGTRSATSDPTGNGNDLTNSDVDKKDPNAPVPDYEYGYDYENAVHTMILVFANKADNAFINYTTVTGIAAVPKSKILTEQFDFTLTAELQYEDLEKAYGEGGPLSGDGEKEVNVFAFCNYSQNLLNEIKKIKEDKMGSTDWRDELKGTVTEEPKKAPEGSIWGQEQFLMTNAKIVTVKFPKTLDDWDPYSYRDNPYFLHKEGKAGQPTKDADGKLQVTPDNYTPIVVERAAARFDFKDGSKGDNTYPLYVDQDYNNVIDPDEDWNLVSIQLKEMSLVNMSQNYYFLRRVSDDGTNTNWNICGPETGTLDNEKNTWKFNYVVDTDYKEKQKVGGITELTAGDHFNFNLFTDKKKYNTDAWDTYSVEDVLNGKEDTWTETHSYHIWRYVTENTIPADKDGKYSQQKTVQSTGVVFKGQIKLGSEYKNGWEAKYGAFITKGAYDAIKASEASKDEEKDAPQEAPTLYSYNNCLYSSIGELISKVKVEPEDGEDGPVEWRVGDPLYVLLTNIFTELNKGVTIENFTESALDTEAKKAFNNMAAQLDPDNGISVYEPDEEGKYYCYYFYWNRHNDNGNPAKMGPMEFCVVRNNVYKLSVVKIDRIGHPTDPDNDPDPVDPEDPDEEAIRYCAVKVEVLPWVVRENEIKF